MANRGDANGIFTVLQEVAPEIPLSLDTPEHQQSIQSIIAECCDCGDSWVAVDADGTIVGVVLAKPDRLKRFHHENKALSLRYVGVTGIRRQHGIFGTLMKTPVVWPMAATERETRRLASRASDAFSSVDPAGTWAWRSGSAAAVRQGAVALVLPRAGVAVQLRVAAQALHAEAVAEPLLRRAVAAEVESQRRAVVELALRAVAAGMESQRRAAVELALRAVAAGMESQRRAAVELALRAVAAGMESQRRAAVELALRAEAAMVELPLHAVAAGVESQRRAVVELPLRADSQ